MNSDKTYDVRHPEMIRVGRDSFVFFHVTDPEGPFDRLDHVSLLLIERIEVLPVPAPAS